MTMQRRTSKPRLVFIDDDPQELADLRLIVQEDYDYVPIQWPYAQSLDELIGETPALFVLDLFFPPVDETTPNGIPSTHVSEQTAAARRIGEDFSHLYDAQLNGKDLLRKTFSNILKAYDLLWAQCADLNQSADNGRALLAQIKSDRRYKQVPVVIYSRKVTVPEAVRALQAGAVSVIQKVESPPSREQKELVLSQLKVAQALPTAGWKSRLLPLLGINVNVTLFKRALISNADKPSRTNRLLRLIPKRVRENKALSALVVVFGFLLLYLPQIANVVESWQKIKRVFVQDPRAELAQLGVQYSVDQFIVSAQQGDTRAVKLFLQIGIDPEARGHFNRTALMEAAENGHLEAVKVLLAKHVNVDAQDLGSDTAMIRAADKGHTPVVLELIAHGAQVNVKGNSGKTALMAASFNGHLETMKALLDHDAEINVKDREEQKTALLLATGNHQTIAVQLLLDRGADPNIQDIYGHTALIIAARGGHSEMIESLLKHHADVHLNTKDGKTALMGALDHKNPQIAELLKKAGAK